MPCTSARKCARHLPWEGTGLRHTWRGDTDHGPAQTCERERVRSSSCAHTELCLVQARAVFQPLSVLGGSSRVSQRCRPCRTLPCSARLQQASHLQGLSRVITGLRAGQSLSGAWANLQMLTLSILLSQRGSLIRGTGEIHPGENQGREKPHLTRGRRTLSVQPAPSENPPAGTGRGAGLCLGAVGRWWPRAQEQKRCSWPLPPALGSSDKMRHSSSSISPGLRGPAFCWQLPAQANGVCGEAVSHSVLLFYTVSCEGGGAAQAAQAICLHRSHRILSAAPQ